MLLGVFSTILEIQLRLACDVNGRQFVVELFCVNAVQSTRFHTASIRQKSETFLPLLSRNFKSPNLLKLVNLIRALLKDIL